MADKGIVYGVGVGPGDPELMTLKACRLIRENEIMAVPGKVPQDAVAYRIASAAVPELAEKTGQRPQGSRGKPQESSGYNREIPG